MYTDVCDLNMQTNFSHMPQASLMQIIAFMFFVKLPVLTLFLLFLKQMVSVFRVVLNI